MQSENTEPEHTESERPQLRRHSFVLPETGAYEIPEHSSYGAPTDPEVVKSIRNNIYETCKFIKFLSHPGLKKLFRNDAIGRKKLKDLKTYLNSKNDFLVSFRKPEPRTLSFLPKDPEIPWDSLNDFAVQNEDSDVVED